MNSRLVDLSGTMLFNRILRGRPRRRCSSRFTLWRFSMTERAPSKRRLRRLAKRAGARSAGRGRCADARRRKPSSRATARPSRWAQFVARLRIEMRQVLTSPGLDRPDPVRRRQSPPSLLWLGQSAYGTPDHPTRVGDDHGAVAAASAIFLLMIAAFYGGELVWRERDRKLNEIIEFDAASRAGS